MKTEEKSNKRFWRRGNVLDIAIILVLVAAICVIGYRYYAANAGGDEADTRAVQIRFAVENVLPGTADALTTGDVLYWESNQQAIGTLALHPQATGTSPVAIFPSEQLLHDAGGNYVSVSSPEGARVDWEGLLNCRGSFHEQNAFLLDGRYILIKRSRIFFI